MTGKPRITAIGGSAEENSSTLSILKYTTAQLVSRGADVTVIDIKEFNLPMYSYPRPGITSDKKLLEFIKKISLSDGYLFASPEYHGTVSAAFKNIIDHFEFLSENNPPYLTGKPVGLIAAAGAENAGYNTLQTMMNIVHSLRGIVAPSSLAVGSANKHVSFSGEIMYESLTRKLNRLAAELYDLSVVLNQNNEQ
jgi:FMN reductase